MMDEKQTEALKKWYSQEWILDAVRKAEKAGEWDDLETHVQRHALMPLSKHAELPDYMTDDEGKPLFPTNCNPLHDQDSWQDAIEVGWAVIEEKTGVSMDKVQGELRKEKNADWEVFMKSIEERKKKRGDSEK
jgi:hypothetical protein